MRIIISKFLRSDKSRQYDFSSIDALILFAIGDFMGNKKTCWPSYRAIEKVTRIKSHSTIRNSIERLESFGILKIKRVYKKNNIYNLNVDNL